MIVVKAGSGHTQTGSSPFDAESHPLACAGTIAAASWLATVGGTVDVRLAQLIDPRILPKRTAELRQHPPRHFVANT